MPKPLENFAFEVIVKRVTDKAILVDCDELEEYVWIPKSEILDPEPEDLSVGDQEEIEIPKWLAIEKGLI